MVNSLKLLRWKSQDRPLQLLDEVQINKAITIHVEGRELVGRERNGMELEWKWQFSI